MILSFPTPPAVQRPGFHGPDGGDTREGAGRIRLARRRASVQTQIGYMRARGMSNTGIRRALGLSEREAVDAGIIPRRVVPNREVAAPAADASGAGGRGENGCCRPTSAPRGPLMADVLAAVARTADVRRDEIAGASQGRRLTALRQLTMYLLRELCPGASLPAIGHFLGRDHTTVHYGCRKAAERLDREPDFRLLYEKVRTGLAPGGAAADG